MTITHERQPNFAKWPNCRSSHACPCQRPDKEIRDFYREYVRSSGIIIKAGCLPLPFVVYFQKIMIPKIAERMISPIGDSFFFAKYLYPNVEAAKSAVMPIACIFTLIPEIVPKQFPNTM